jgi:hypothetical protein
MSQQQEIPPNVQLMQMMSSKMVAKPIYAVAKLGVPDLIKDRPKTAVELAQATGTHAPSLYRVLRALASLGVFSETSDGRFERTPLSQLLESAPQSMRGFAIMFGEPWHDRAWSEILHSIKTGQSGFGHAMGVTAFEFFHQNAEAAGIFNGAMTSFSANGANAVLQAYSFEGIQKLVDVAGGHGFLLQAIMKATPGLRGVLFDLPQVVEGSAPVLSEVRNRCEVVGGNFFDAVTVSADAYCLKHILHDWDDARSTQILKNIHKSALPDAKLLLIEMVIPPGNAPSFGKLLDLEMLVMTEGGKERTEAEYRELLSTAGWKLSRIVPTQAPISVIESVRV